MQEFTRQCYSSAMPSRAETLFLKLRSKNAIEALLGTAEDADFDCKEWHGTGDAGKRSIAKAVCGFTNATGGVLVIGVSASGRGADTPDVVHGFKPVEDMGAVKSAVLDMIQKLVEPGIEGVQVEMVAKSLGSQSGYLLVYIPKTEGAPRRSKVDWKFYVRIASGTIPMEYFQIQSMFGVRPHPKLVATIAYGHPERSRFNIYSVVRPITLTISNEGRGLAKFPALSCQQGEQVGYNPIHTLKQSPWAFSVLNSEWISFRGGADHVVYPGESIEIADLMHFGTQIKGVTHYGQRTGDLLPWDFLAVNLITEVVCDGIPATRFTFEIPDFRFNPRGWSQI